MGIFSSTYKTYVGTSISRFADMNTFVSSKDRGVISGIARGEDIVDHTLDYLMTGPGQKAKTSFRFSGAAYVDEYGNATPKYVFGRPQDYVISKSLGNYYATNALKDYLLKKHPKQEHEKIKNSYCAQMLLTAVFFCNFFNYT